MIRNELRHEVVAVPEPTAAVTLKGEAQCKAKLIGIGGRQLGGVIAHAGKLDRFSEQIKNIESGPFVAQDGHHGCHWAALIHVNALLTATGANAGHGQ
jgi:hypothetical protein